MEIRDQFQAICREHHVVKKTTSGPEKWQAVKERLIDNHAHLSHIFHQSDLTQMDRLHLSLDVICMDVTKRMRGSEHAMTLAEAKNLLGINPETGRQLRQALIDLLTTNNFVNKHESGNWDQLRQRWIEESGLLQRIAPVGSQEHDKGLRAIQMICRDIMKRWRDMHVNPTQSRVPASRDTETSAGPVLLQQHPAHSPANGGPSLAKDSEGDYDFQIDPSLLMAAREQPLNFQNLYANDSEEQDTLLLAVQGSGPYYH